MPRRKVRIRHTSACCLIYVQPYYDAGTAFYSLTLYDKEWNLVDNAINRCE